MNVSLLIDLYFIARKIADKVEAEKPGASGADKLAAALEDIEPLAEAIGAVWADVKPVVLTMITRIVDIAHRTRRWLRGPQVSGPSK